MAVTQAWYSQSIFISSTFSDMMAERDHLRDFVFPELAERLRARRYHLEPVDLRWGVETVSLSEQQSKEMLVLKVCLDEIERCKPFFIGLLGDRYGWVPPENRMQAAINEKGFNTDVSGKSVTALEIEFGVLASQEQRQRSFFYFRQPLPLSDMPPEIAALYSDEYVQQPGAKQAAKRLEQLKNRILKKLGSKHVREYEADWDNNTNRVINLEKWGSQVLEDIWKELDGHTHVIVSAPTPTWQEQDRTILDEFVEGRSINFIGRTELIADLKQFAFSPATAESWGLCLQGAPGTGKSALFAKLHRELEKENCLLLSHAAGISVRSTGMDALIRRWIKELAAYLNLSDKAPSKELESFEEKKKLFAELLSRASVKTRVICLVDALNQLERTPTVRHMTWLPEFWPQNARLICTAIPGEEIESLTKRTGVRSVTVEPLTEKDAEEIIHTICRVYHKTIHADFVKILASKKQPNGDAAFGNPLWLNMAVNELLLLDEDDFARAKAYKGTPEQQLHSLMLDIAETMPATVMAMYGYLFLRAEKRFGEKWLQTVVHLLAVSRFGLREEDLKAVVPQQTGEGWNDLQFAAFRRYFRAHLVQKGEQGLWDFNHSQARLWLEDGPFKQNSYCKSLHKLLADYLNSLNSNDSLRQTEIMFHLMNADEKMQAALYLGSRDLTKPEESGACKVLAEAILQVQGQDTSPGLVWTVSLLTIEELKNNTLKRICEHYQFTLMDMLANDGYVQTRLNLMLSVLKITEELHRRTPDSAEYARDLSVSNEKLGKVYELHGDLQTALKHYESSLKIAEELSSSAPDSAGYARDSSISHESLGNIYVEHGDLQTALKHYQSSLKIRKELRRRAPNSALLAYDESASYEKLGGIYIQLGDPGAALKHYESSHKIREELHRRVPDSDEYTRSLSVSYDNLGYIYEKLGDLQAALKHYESAFNIRKELHRQTPDSTEYAGILSSSHERLGDIYAQHGDLQTALKHYESLLDLAEELHRRTPDSTKHAHGLFISHNRLGHIYEKLGDLQTALKHYKNSFNLIEQLHRRAPNSAKYTQDLSISYERLGYIYEKLGDLQTALKHYESSFNLIKELHHCTPNSAEYSRTLSASYIHLGDIYGQLGDPQTTLKYYKSSLNLAEELCRRAPDSVEFARDLIVNYNKLGTLFFQLGDPYTALTHYLNGNKIALELHHRAPDSVQYKLDLSLSYNCIGDVYCKLNDLQAALGNYINGYKILEELHRCVPDAVEYSRELADTYEKIGNISVQLGVPQTALKSYENSLKIKEELYCLTPISTEHAYNLFVLYEKMSDIYDQLGDLQTALGHYKNGHKIIEKLFQITPASVISIRNLSVSYNKLGALYLKYRKPQIAVKYFENAINMREELCQIEPTSTEHALDLAALHDTIGQIYPQFGNHQAALNHFEKSVKIREVLHRFLPKSTESMNDLAIAYYNVYAVHNHIGNIKECQKYKNICKQLQLYMKNKGMQIDAGLDNLIKKL